MKKFNLIVLSVFACIASANAQIDGDEGFGQKPKSTTVTQNQGGKRIKVVTKNYNYELSVGPRAGVGISTMSGLRYL